MIKKIFALSLAFMLASSGFAATRLLRVTSPSSGDFLGKSNTVKFHIDNAQYQVTVTVKATYTGTGGGSVTVKDDFQPNGSNQIDGSINLNFSDGATQGVWKIVVTPSERDANGVAQTYSPASVTLTNLTVDVKAPTFYSVNPLDGTFVKGDANNKVRIVAALNEPNLDKWKVQVGGSDFANNEGTKSPVDVLWDIKGITKNGPQALTIKVDDKAKNSVTKTVNLTIDRTKPSSQIVSPGPNTTLPPHTDILVSIKVTDNFSDSVDLTGIDVIAQTTGGGFITRAARKSFSSSGNSVVWSGRIRYTSKIPNQFKLVVKAVDKAGNPAVIQQTLVKIGGR